MTELTMEKLISKAMIGNSRGIGHKVSEDQKRRISAFFKGINSSVFRFVHFFPIQ